MKIAKQNEGQPIENKRFREIADSASSMISMTCDTRRETLGFVWRNESSHFRGFWPRRRKKRNGEVARPALRPPFRSRSRREERPRGGYPKGDEVQAFHPGSHA